MIETVRSADGTPIAFERTGAGPPLVLVHGTAADRTRWAGVRPALERHFSVIAMDRRGRGDSGDAAHYAIEREFEDVAAVIRAAGAGANVLGHSFGALCTMEAALRVDNLRRMVLYEPAFPPDETPIYAPGVRERFQALLDAGDIEVLLDRFFRELVEADDAQIAAMRSDPSWAGRLAAAHTLVREMDEADYRFDPERFRGLSVPTLMLSGETSPGFLAGATRLVDAALPDSRIVVMAGQGHVAISTAPELFLREVLAFLTG